MVESLVAFGSEEIDIQYKATYLTDVINRKLAGVVPVGIHRGFILEATATPDFITIAADPSGDGHVATVENVAHRSVSLRKTGGNFNLDLSAPRAATASPTTWVIVLWAQYESGKNTGAAFRAYTQAEYDGAGEKDTLVVLGKVTLQNSTPAEITADEITLAGRMSAWTQEQPERAPWRPLVQNGSFEGSQDLATHSHATSGWVATNTTDSNSEWRPTDTESLVGDFSLELNALVTTATSNAVVAPIGMRLSEGTRIRMRFFYKVLETLDSGSVLAIAVWNTFSSTTIETVVELDLSAITAGWVELDTLATAPVDATSLSSVGFLCSAADPLSTGAVVRIDAVQAWAEPEGLDSYGEVAQPYVNELGTLRFQGFVSRGASGLLESDGAGVSYTRADDTAAAPPFGFKGVINEVGTDKLTTFADQTTARISANYQDTEDSFEQDTLTLVMENLSDSGSGTGVRTYIDDIGTVYRTVNAYYVGSYTWTRDVATEQATRVDWNKDGTVQYYRATADNTTGVAWGGQFFPSGISDATNAFGWEQGWLYQTSEPDFDGSSPWTADFSPNGASGKIRVAATTPTQTQMRLYCFAQITTGNYKGWYFIDGVAVGADYFEYTLKEMGAGTATFPSSGTESVIFYQGTMIGQGGGFGAALRLQAPGADDDLLITYQPNDGTTGKHLLCKSSSADVFYVDNAGGVTAVGAVTSTTGDIVATAGDVIATAGDVIATAGDVIATAGDVIATTGNLQASDGDVIALGDGSVDGFVKGEVFEYNTPPTRTVMVPLQQFVTSHVTSTGAVSFWNNGAFLYAETPSVSITAPLLLPDGATLDTVSCYLWPGSGNTVAGAGRMNFMVSKIAYSSGTTSTVQGKTYVASDPHTGNSEEEANASSISEVIDNSTYSYYIQVQATDAADSINADSVRRPVKITFTDPGPRNY